MKTKKLAWAFPLVLGAGIAVIGLSLPSCSSTCSDEQNCGPYEPEGGSSGNGSGTGGSTGGKGGSGSPAGGSSSGNNMEGGGAGEAGGGGSPQEPCDGACVNPKRFCNEETDTCVECLHADNCTTGAKTKCNDLNTCVECIDATTDCVNAAAAKCDGGACVKCTSNDDCLHIDGKGVCDVAAGECVQCTVSDETGCGGKSCHPTSKTCTDTTKGSVSNCKACVADSECTGGDQADPDARCVPMEFNGALRPGGFCLRRVSKTCGRPYTIAISAESLSGAAAESYCGIDQQNVTCEAVVDLEDSRTCKDLPDSACGCTRTNDQDAACMEPGKGGLCRDFVAVQDRCTYQCGALDHCPTGFTCVGSPTKYCQ